MIVASASVRRSPMNRHWGAKIRLNGGRAILGELIEQSSERLKLRDLKSGKEVAYSQGDLLKVEGNVTDNDDIAAAGLPVFVA